MADLYKAVSFVSLVLVLLLSSSPCVMSVDNCANSTAIFNPICGTSTPSFTNCANNSCATGTNAYVQNMLLQYADSFGPTDHGTKYTGAGPLVTRAQCCQACQANSTCDAFNYISSRSDAGCYFISE